MSIFRKQVMNTKMCRLGGLILACFLAPVARAELPTYTLIIERHIFSPEVLRVPANTRFKLLVINRDSTAEEFESYELNREKVIAGQQQATLFIGPLPPGEYPFFGEFNPHTAVGKLIAE